MRFGSWSLYLGQRLGFLLVLGALALVYLPEKWCLTRRVLRYISLSVDPLSIALDNLASWTSISLSDLVLFLSGDGWRLIRLLTCKSLCLCIQLLLAEMIALWVVDTSDLRKGFPLLDSGLLLIMVDMLGLFWAGHWQVRAMVGELRGVLVHVLSWS